MKEFTAETRRAAEFAEKNRRTEEQKNRRTEEMIERRKRNN
jgi:hypothetical protein